MIHVYTGDGKGKTTAALGLIIRALGSEKKVCLIQFMKKDQGYGEIKFLKSCNRIEIYQYGSGNFVDPSKPEKIDLTEAEDAYEKAKSILREGNHDILVLDEINTAVAWGLISLKKQLSLMELTENRELIMTGRSANNEIIDRADLVTEMKSIKHYYQKGIKARKGIEF